MYRVTSLIIVALLVQPAHAVAEQAQVAQVMPTGAPSGSDNCSGFRTNSALCDVTGYVNISPSQQGYTAPERGPTVVTRSGVTKSYLPYDKIMVGPDGRPCIGTGYYEEGTSSPRPAQGPSEPDEGPGNSSSLYSTAPPCPVQPRSPGESQPVETPAMIARRHWEEIPLPAPRPRIEPGRAITGKLAYLQTNGRTTHTYTTNTIFGPLQIAASGSYTVNWGDGHTTGPYAFEGTPWPGGNITHEYQHVGSYDIVVTERWTATWSFAGQSGVLRTLQTEGRIDNFPVEQIQAVIRR